MSQQPTPETDAFEIEHAFRGTAAKVYEFARRLERERDEARQNAQDMIAERDALLVQLGAWHKEFQTSQLTHAAAERDQLRKACDELAKRCFMQCAALDAYNSLPHVIAANKSKE